MANNFPPYYDRSKVGTTYVPDLQRAYDAGVTLRGTVTPSALESTLKVLLWLIDVQIDFVFPAPVGKLPVPNAVGDTERTVEFIYNNVGKIHTIAASLDTHTPFQIFYQTWWKNAKGESPAPFTEITLADVQAGIWQPVVEPVWSMKYLAELESSGKKKLMIWPFHCMEGSTGRSLVPSLSEAIQYHSGARVTQPRFLVKGTIPYVEYYSVLEPEVKYPRRPDGNLNVEFMKLVTEFDLIYVGGQARSHCVLETMNSVMRQFANTPKVYEQFRFLDDCTSCIPGFEASTQAALDEMVRKGVVMVKSTDPIK